MTLLTWERRVNLAAIASIQGAARSSAPEHAGALEASMNAARLLMACQLVTSRLRQCWAGEWM